MMIVSKLIKAVGYYFKPALTLHCYGPANFDFEMMIACFMTEITPCHHC